MLYLASCRRATTPGQITIDRLWNTRAATKASVRLRNFDKTLPTTIMAPDIFDQTRRNSPSYYGPVQTALLLLYYKELVINRIGPKAQETVKIAASMRQWAKSKSIPVLHCLVDFSGTAPFPTCKESDRLSMLSSQVQKESGGDEPPELLEGSRDVEFVRRPGHISALQSEGIRKYFAEKEVKSLAIMGLSTGGCVLRTAFEAAEDEFMVTVIEDGCAGGREEVHEFLFAKVFGRGDFVTSAREFRDGYGRLYG